MAIDPSTIVWDDEPQSQHGTPLPKIDPASVIWDDSPITDMPSVNALPPDFSGVSSSVDSTAAGRQADGWQAGAGRDLAFGARSVIQGAGGLLGAIGGDALGALETRITGRPVASFRDNAAALADRIGLPKAQTGADRVLGDVGEALTGTGLTLGIGGGLNALANLGRSAAAGTPGYVAPATNRFAELLMTQPGLQTASAAGGAGASSVTRESGGTQGQQLAAGLVGGLGPGVAAAGAGATLRGVVRGRSGEQMRNRLADFEALGATPSVGQASGNRLVQGLENVLSGGPTSAGVMGRFAERQADDIGSGLRQMADNFTPNASAERAGRAVERGVELFGRNLNANKRALYWNADRFIPETTPVALNNTMQAMTRLTTPMQGAAATTGALVNPRLAALQRTLADDLAAGNGQIPYAALKRIRTNIGEQISDYSLTPETPTRELKQLYAGLSRDMEAAAQAQGPEAVRAAKRANNYTRAAADRLEQVQRVIDKNGGPERVYAAAMSGTRDGGTTLRAVMQSLPNEGQQAVTGAVIKRMGMANPSAQDAAGETFSAATFLTNWNKVSPEAKRALFDRHGPQFSSDMDRIARVADNIKTGSQVFANPSGTANRAAAMTYGASLAMSMLDPSFSTTGALLLGGAAANRTARWLTNPMVVRRLSQATALPKGAIPGFANAVMAEGEKDNDPDLLELAGELEKSVEQSPR